MGYSLHYAINLQQHIRISAHSVGDNGEEVILMINEPKTLVKCSVSNCHFWGEANLCQAEKIVIEIDDHAGRNLNEEFGEEHFNNHQDNARTSSSTCCLTFKPK
jgi:hypothetical protein